MRHFELGTSVRHLELKNASFLLLVTSKPHGKHIEVYSKHFMQQIKLQLEVNRQRNSYLDQLEQTSCSKLLVLIVRRMTSRLQLIFVSTDDTLIFMPKYTLRFCVPIEVHFMQEIQKLHLDTLRQLEGLTIGSAAAPTYLDTLQRLEELAFSISESTSTLLDALRRLEGLATWAAYLNDLRQLEGLAVSLAISTTYLDALRRPDVNFDTS